MTAAVFGTLLGAAIIHLLRAVRRTRTRSAPEPVTPWRPVPDGTRWLPCHSLTCAHLTTRHTPQTDSTWHCTDCGNTRKDTHP